MERTISADVKRLVETIGAIIDQPARKKFLSANKGLQLIREGDYFKVRFLSLVGLMMQGQWSRICC